MAKKKRHLVWQSDYQRGFTLQQLRNRVRERLLIEPPDHVLIVEDEPGLRRLLHRELSEMIPLTVEATSPEKLTENQGLVVGAVVVSMPGRAKRVVSLLPRGHPFLPLEPSDVDIQVNRIRQLKEASVIAVASISQALLHFARALLAPVVGSLHTMEEYLLDEKETKNLSCLDLVICDTVARRGITAREVVAYRLISSRNGQEILSRIASSVD